MVINSVELSVDQVINTIREELLAARKLNDELRKILELVFDGILVCDGQGNVSMISSRTAQMCGVKEGDFLGKPIADLEQKGFFYPSATLQVLKSKKKQVLIQDLHTGIRFLNTATPIFDEEGNISQVICLSRDITRITTLEKQLEETQTLIDYYREEITSLLKEKASDEHYIFKSPQIENIFKLVLKIAKFNCTLLIQGESGVGKDMLAQEIHRQSSRAAGPFVKLNCAAIPENLLESELFGYAPGAFTGALNKGKPGQIELANGGTLMLNEIGELPLNLQAKLLHILEEHKLLRVGGSQPIQVDVRFIAATNRDLEAMVKEKVFREDLYYRLKVIPIKIPPLRERQEDTAELIKYYLGHFNKLYGAIKTLSKQAFMALYSYRWPGNIRELRHCLERLVLLSNVDVIDISDVNLVLCEQPQDFRVNEPNQDDDLIGLREAIESMEKQLLEKAYQRLRTTREISKVLGIDQSTVARKLKKYGLRINIRS